MNYVYDRWKNRLVQDFNEYEKLPNGTIAISCIKTNVSSFLVPRDIIINNETYLITRIFSFSFSQTRIKRLVFALNSCVETIESNAFSSSNLKKIELPKTLKQLGSKALFGCENLKITIPNDNRFFVLGEDSILYRRGHCVALFSNKNFYHVTLRRSLTSISSGAFSGTNISRILIPASVVNIDSYAFSSCYNLKKLEFEKDSRLDIIGGNAFSNTRIRKIYFPESLSQILSFAFESCIRLTAITFPADTKISVITVDSFRKCSSLTEVNAPRDKEKFILEILMNKKNQKKNKHRTKK